MFSSNLCGQYALYWDIPSRDTVLYCTMGQEGTVSRERSNIIVRLFVMRTLGGEGISVGRDCKLCVNNCRAE